MNQKSAAIVGYGNIGKAALEALRAAPDFTVAGIVRRDAAAPQPQELHGIPVVSDIAALGQVDVAILALPTRQVPDTAEALLRQGIHTVDSYDIHGGIWDLKCRLDTAGKAGGAAAVVAAGWDPGTDSVIRALMLAMAPRGITYTDFGPGMSMGHTVAAKAVTGVKNALSMTIPLGTGVHRRMVYVELAAGAQLPDVTAALKADPYFAHDETHVIAVPDVDALLDKGHGVHMARKGVSGETQNQLFDFYMKIDNPALTAQNMVAAARAVLMRAPGAYTMIELPAIDLLPGDREELIRALV